MKIIQKGDENGNGMVVRFRLPSGLEIFSLPTKNFYGGHWDLGPTWNYAVMADRPFLVDAGRFGQGKHLLKMLQVAGINPGDLAFVLISHGHEDHDGGLSELVELTDIKVKAHTVYDLLIRQYPALAPEGYKQHFPAKCWHCIMPVEFFEANCLGYHRVLQALSVERVGDEDENFGDGIGTMHLPGHSPDSLAVMLGDEAIIAGDVVLPDITPWPTRLEQYAEAEAVLAPLYPRADALFGLNRYLGSLGRLRDIARHSPDIRVFPAHRVYYQSHWNEIHLAERLEQLFEHHIQRCASILEIVSGEARDVDEIARRHFKEVLLKGPGKRMAAYEIISHAEVLLACGDLVEVAKHRYAATGSAYFEQHIRL